MTEFTRKEFTTSLKVNNEPQVLTQWATDRERAEEVATWLAEAHAWHTFEFESDHTVEECQAWLTAYDHSVEQWVYDMPNPLEVWEEVYSDHTHDDHTRTYAWARAYAHAYTHMPRAKLTRMRRCVRTHIHAGGTRVAE